MVVIQADGEEVDRFIGYAGDPSAPKSELERILAGENTLQSLKQAYEENPDDPTAAARLAKWYLSKYQWDQVPAYITVILENEEAAKEATGAFGMEGQEVSAYEFARALEGYQSPERAAAFFEEFPKSELDDDVLSLLARHLRDMKQRTQTLKIFEDIQTTHPSNYNAFAYVVRHFGDLRTETDAYGPAEGLRYAEPMFEQFGAELETNDRQSLATIFLAANKPDKALEVFGPDYAAGLIDEKDANGLNGYAWYWALKGENLSNALHAAQKAVEFAPEDANIWDTLSMVYWRMGNHQEAIQAEMRALELNPDASENFQKRIDDIRADMETQEGEAA